MKNPIQPLPLIEPTIDDFACETAVISPELREQLIEHKLPLKGKIAYIRTIYGPVIDPVWRKTPEKYYDILDLEWYRKMINVACSIFLS